MNYDIAVAGGGPAGAVVAYHLAKQNKKVLIIERQIDDSIIKVGESLPPAANPVLNRLGIDQKILETNFLASSGIRSAWGSAELIDSDYIRDPYGNGWLLDRSKFNTLLCSQAVEAGAKLLQPAQVTDVLQSGDHWQLQIKQQTEAISIKAKFLVDATGRASWLAKKLGIKRVHHDRLLAHAICFYPNETTEISSLKNTQRRTVVESVEDGWWYGTPLPNGKKIAVFLTDQGTEPSKEARSLAGFLNKLRLCRQVYPFIGEKMIESAESPTVFAADSSCLENVTGQRWLAVGDAASAFDPISGQGILASIFNSEKSAQAILAGWSGNLQKIIQYEKHVQDAFQSYLKNLKLTYKTEKRWSSSLFWKKRIM